MTIDSILAQIDSEIARLTQVRALLSGSGTTVTKAATKTASKTASKASSAAPAGRPKKRVLSSEARKRIAEAQRKRWAAQKAKTAKSK